MIAAAICAHELLISYVEAGFTRDEAFQLIRDMMTNASNTQGPTS